MQANSAFRRRTGAHQGKPIASHADCMQSPRQSACSAPRQAHRVANLLIEPHDALVLTRVLRQVHAYLWGGEGAVMSMCMQAAPRYPCTLAFCLPRLFLLWATMAVNGFEFRLSLGCASFGSPSSCSGSGSPPEPTNGEPTNGEPPEPTNEEPEAEPEPEPEPPSREVRARSLAPLSSHATVEVPECPTPTMITSR